MSEESLSPFPGAFNISDYMTLAEAAQTLGCHVNSIRTWVNKGRLKAFRIGARLYAKRDDVVNLPSIVIPSYTQETHKADKDKQSLEAIPNLFTIKDGQPCFKDGIYTGKYPFGSVDKHGYVHFYTKIGPFTGHKVSFILHHGRLPVIGLDHINGNPSDNRIENLREATPRENSCNKARHREGRLPGAIPKDNKWSSVISYKGKTHQLGLYETELEAHNAYLEFLKLNGEAIPALLPPQI